MDLSPLSVCLPALFVFVCVANKKKRISPLFLNYSFSISSIDKPVTNAIWSCGKPKSIRFFAVSSLACVMPNEIPLGSVLFSWKL